MGPPALHTKKMVSPGESVWSLHVQERGVREMLLMARDNKTEQALTLRKGQGITGISAAQDEALTG